jgi:glycosyltransferase involved in cell wall biosynthesis
MSVLSYAAITPARNELENLLRLAGSLESQTKTPERWIVVDNGSTDGTMETARDLAKRLPWVRLVETEGTASPQPGAPIVKAFHAGLRSLDIEPDILVKLDADVSMEADYFERQLCAFEADDRLGISSGTCLEFEDGKWRPMDDVTDGHVRGAARAYRRACLQELLPLEERVGWDGLDGVKATMRGWKTLMVADLFFRHHRVVGERDGRRAARWQAQGRASWFMGYRPTYLVVRSLYRAAREDPAALSMITSYASAALRREPRCDDAEVRAYLRSQQGFSGIVRRGRPSSSRLPG